MIIEGAFGSLVKLFGAGGSARGFWGGVIFFMVKLPFAHEELPFSFPGERVAAMRGLENRGKRNPADPKVSHAQPP